VPESGALPIIQRSIGVCVANLLVWLNCIRPGLTCRNGIAMHAGMCQIMLGAEGTGYEG